MSTSALSNEIDPLAPLASVLGGDFKVGQQAVNYNISGEANYLYSFEGFKTGYQNSLLDATFSSSLGAVSLVSGTRVSGDYSGSKRNYDAKVATSLTAGYKNHELKVGYDKHMVNKMFGGFNPLNTDRSYTRNSLGQYLNSFGPYVDYSVSVKNIQGVVSYDSDDNYYMSISVFEGTDNLRLSAFNYDDNISGFIDFRTELEYDVSLMVGLGRVDDDTAVIVDAHRFITPHSAAYTKTVSSHDETSTVVGYEHSYRVLSAYMEYEYPWGDNDSQKDKDYMLAAGLKLTF
ncbi:hypothetical protein ACQKQC_15915 [Vibrio fortis]|uniref:hypothetical protein n=1 Tax=Vibrio fortis TaxID=212667 RepID=UPI0040692DF1